MRPFNTPWRKVKTMPELLENVTQGLVDCLGLLDEFVGYRVVCHCLYDEDRAPSNLHRLGMAADLHITGMHPLEQFLAAERLRLFGGIGIYGIDVWNNPGLHVDIRHDEYGARWAFRAGVATPSKRVQVPFNKKYIEYLLEIMP